MQAACNDDWFLLNVVRGKDMSVGVLPACLCAHRPRMGCMLLTNACHRPGHQSGQCPYGHAFQMRHLQSYQQVSRMGSICLHDHGDGHG